MKKSFIKKAVDDFYQKLNQELDMKQYEVAAFNMKTCVTAKGEWFVHTEATVASVDPNGTDYRMSKDYDLPKKTKAE